MHGEKQVKGVDYWNTYTPVVQGTTTRLMLLLHQKNNWKCRHLDYVLVLTQAPIDTDACLRMLAGFHIENENGDDTSDEHCLQLLKNCDGKKDDGNN